MTATALMEHAAISTSSSRGRAASDVAKKMTAAAPTVISGSALSTRLVDASVVIATHATIASARKYSGRHDTFHVRCADVAQNASSATSTSASPRKTTSFTSRKRSAPPL